MVSLHKNTGFSLVDLGDGVGFLRIPQQNEFPRRCIFFRWSPRPLSRVPSRSWAINFECVRLSIMDACHFSVVANIMIFCSCHSRWRWDEFDLAIKQFQFMTPDGDFCASRSSRAVRYWLLVRMRDHFARISTATSCGTVIWGWLSSG